jgi:hypothetical protein
MENASHDIDVGDTPGAIGATPGAASARAARLAEVEARIRALPDRPDMDQELLALLASFRDDPDAVERINGWLRDIGGTEVGYGEPLDIRAFYKPGDEKFELRWPLAVTIPFGMSWDDLDRETQFHVLFAEWSRRGMEAANALLAGTLEEAERAYDECLERADQLEVGELSARALDGLRSIAGRRNDAAAERRWLLAAAAVRRG